MGIYPFEFAALEDFEPIVTMAIQVSSKTFFGLNLDTFGVDDSLVLQKGLKEPYDWDEYAQIFMPKGVELIARAQEADRQGEVGKASELYL